MKDNYAYKPASQDELTLYCFLGEAVCKIQHLEAALSCLITIKKHPEASKAEADEALNEYRHYTLGQAVRLAKTENFLPLPLQIDLNHFNKKRNWLIHHAMFENIDNLSSDDGKNQLFNKIKSTANDAEKIRRAIEMELICYSESKGRDMSKIRAAIEKYDNG